MFVTSGGTFFVILFILSEIAVVAFAKCSFVQYPFLNSINPTMEPTTTIETPTTMMILILSMKFSMYSYCFIFRCFYSSSYYFFHRVIPVTAKLD